ncbi:MAG: sugar phosphate nucleotidyltransferase [Pseudoflavonifractor sp.]|nr:sugar phosphate nucleotidyltransferase [Alloprevotella sp.]MCM1116887.1 sugar phosphate nucleotidyltransferase [Pseudoflavonifractor sp.]
MTNHIIPSSASILEALQRLNDLSGHVMTLFVVEPDGRMSGSLTDGDIRRGLLAGASLDSPVALVARHDFHSLEAEAPNLALLRLWRSMGIKLIPLLRPDGSIAEILDTTATTTRLPVSAILMAGGKGERLRPLTLSTPKPLLTIDDKAIIDYNIEAMERAGIGLIRVAVNYMADKLVAHFAERDNHAHIECVGEPSPLGTIGAASLMNHEPGGLTLVMNADILTTLPLEDFYLHHCDCDNDITIAAIPYNVAVPYAILSTDPSDPSRVTALEEKPSYSYYANAGIYLISNDLLNALPKGQRTDATDLIDTAIASGHRVGYFPISGVWIDIGSPADFAHARELMRQHRLLG